MIRFTRYLAVLISLFAAMTSCVDESEQLVVNSYVGGNAVTVFGRITGFDDQMVDTRSAKDMDESYTSSMAMAIFPIEGGALGECISYIHLQGSNLNFTVDRAKIRETYTEGVNYDNTPMAIYLFANVPELPATFAELTDKRFSFFMDKVYANSGIRRPQKGFPMVGSLGDTITEGADDQEFVLIPTEGSGENLKVLLPTLGGTPSDYIPIPLKSLYAKFSFAISIQPDQHIQDGVVPEFTLEKYSLHNVPSQFQATSGSNANHTQVLSDAITTSVGNTINEGGTIEFDFYLPERFLTPAISASNYDYPLGEGGALVKESSVRVEDKPYLQRFKPKLVDASQKATYITLEGYYLDHQNHRWHVYYDIYLGKDNYSNFDFERNKNYINNVVIRGLKASKDQNATGEGVFVDHRVTVERSLPIIINLQRETLLDSHFEVRPLRVRYPGTTLPTGAKVKVEILNEDGTNTNIPTWVRMEHNNGGSATATHLASGKRKYFTTNLVTETLAGNTLIEQNITEANKNETFWIYIDQCDEGAPLSDPNQMRDAMVKVTYTDLNRTESMSYKICQHLLYPIQTTRNGEGEDGSTYTYYIEYEEEYLHNYDSEDSYNSTEEAGMEWGLNDIQLSSLYPANYLIWTDNSNEWSSELTTEKKQEILNNVLTDAGLDPKYDFYLPRDIDNTSLTIREFSGYTYNDEIAEYLNTAYSTYQNDVSTHIAKIEGISLEEQPKSAFAYCYNRNKRDSDGKVESIDWYLPAIDEIEDIMEFAYGDFDTEFQGNMYWSCQPSYIPYYIQFYRYRYYLAWWSQTDETIDGYYYTDDKSNARATKALRIDGGFTGVPDSGADTYQEFRDGKIYISATSYASGNNTAEIGKSITTNTNYKNSENHPGNLPRTGTKARVRCVRNPSGVTVRQ